MAVNKQIYQLPNKSILEANDLLVLSDESTPNHTTKNIQWQQILNDIKTQLNGDLTVVNVRAFDGSDSTGNGSTLNPYQTIEYALSQITDASSSKIYVLNCLGNFSETNFLIKPFISYQFNNSQLTVLNTVELDASWSTGGYAFIYNLFNCDFQGGINLDFDALNVPFGVLFVDRLINSTGYNLTITGNASGTTIAPIQAVFGFGAEPNIQITNCYGAISGSTTQDLTIINSSNTGGVFGVSAGCQILGDLSIGLSGASAGLQLRIDSAQVIGNTTYYNTSTAILNIIRTNVVFVGQEKIDESSGTIQWRYDGFSTPPLVVNGNPQLIPLTIAESVGSTDIRTNYMPTDASVEGNLEGIDSEFGSVTSALNNKVNKSGDTMTGDLILNADATQPLQAVTYQQLSAAVMGIYRLQGGYNPTLTNLYPVASDTTNPVSPNITQGMVWNVTNAGAINGITVEPGDQILALIDSPGQIDANWLIIEYNLGYIPLSQDLLSGKMFVGNASNVATPVTISGDMSMSNTGVATLAAVNGNVGTFGSSSQSVTFSVDGKGRITAAANALITPAAIGAATVADITLQQAYDNDLLITTALNAPARIKSSANNPGTDYVLTFSNTGTNDVDILGISTFTNTFTPGSERGIASFKVKANGAYVTFLQASGSDSSNVVSTSLSGNQGPISLTYGTLLSILNTVSSPVAILYSTAASTGNVSTSTFQARDSALNTVTYAAQNTAISSNAAGVHSGSLIFQVAASGVVTDYLTLDGATAKTTVSNSDLHVTTVGRGFGAKEGTNGCQGAVTLLGGSAVVSTNTIAPNTRIFLTGQDLSGDAGELSVSNRTPGVSFTIRSESITDTRLVAYELFQPAA